MILWAIWSTPYMEWQEGLDPHMSSSRPRQGGYIPGLQRRTRKRFQEAHQMTQSHTSYLQLTGTVQTSGRSLMCQSKHLPYPSCYLNSEWWPPDSLQWTVSDLRSLKDRISLWDQRHSFSHSELHVDVLLKWERRRMLLTWTSEGGKEFPTG